MSWQKRFFGEAVWEENDFETLKLEKMKPTQPLACKLHFATGQQFLFIFATFLLSLIFTHTSLINMKKYL